MVTEKAADGALVWPEESVSVAVRLCVPSLSTDVGRVVQWPLPSAVAIPIWVVPSNTLTVLLATAVPVRVGVLSLVIWSPTIPLSVENEVICGAAGGVGGGVGAEPGAAGAATGITEILSKRHWVGSCRKSNSRFEVPAVPVTLKVYSV